MPYLSSEKAPHRDKTAALREKKHLWSQVPERAGHQDIYWLTVSRNVTWTSAWNSAHFQFGSTWWCVTLPLQPLYTRYGLDGMLHGSTDPVQVPQQSYLSETQPQPSTLLIGSRTSKETIPWEMFGGCSNHLVENTTETGNGPRGTVDAVVQLVSNVAWSEGRTVWKAEVNLPYSPLCGQIQERR
jgi:hypothetical protein